MQYEAKPLPDTLRVIAGVSTTPGGQDYIRCPEVLLGATLDIAADGSLRRTSRLAYPCLGTLPRPANLPDSTMQVEAGHVIIAGDSLALSFDASSPGPMTPHVEYARISGTDLVVYLIRSGADLGTVESLPRARVYRHE